ncbi:hypothetical protein CC78DRAFT_580484 [Lojkania enalia]|uniref:Uncharacterized protein n=1 Tax=Lojkania enalia TaxID=147567 RepID=A0A9P4K985_9PLEO|nr:hypothetical protein CC78DRAFT_580484 [Didymosphaeria enalia]
MFGRFAKLLRFTPASATKRVMFHRIFRIANICTASATSCQVLESSSSRRGIAWALMHVMERAACARWACLCERERNAVPRVTQHLKAASGGQLPRRRVRPQRAIKTAVLARTQKSSGQGGTRERAQRGLDVITMGKYVGTIDFYLGMHAVAKAA